MALRVEEAAVEGGHIERRAALVDDAEERFQLGPEGGRIWQQGLVCIQVLLDALLHAVQAVALAVTGVLTHRQQFARLGVEDEEQAVEDDERVIVNRLECVRVLSDN